MQPFGTLGPLEDRIRAEAQEELWRYLSAAARVGPGARLTAAAKLARLAPEGFIRLAKAHFLLSTEVQDFVEAVPAILRRGARTTLDETKIARDVRGPVDWAHTLATRSLTGWAEPLFAVREPEPSNDLIPNQVLKSTLLRLERDALQVARTTRLDAETDAEKSSFRTLMQAASSVGVRASRLLRSPLLAGVASSRRVSRADLQIAYRHRNRRYRSAVRVQNLRKALVELQDPEALRSLWEKRLLEPAQVYRTFEIWVLSRLARLLERHCDLVTPLPLLVEGTQGPVYRFHCVGGREVEMFYQTVPAPMRAMSAYRHIFDAYSLDVSSRIPDLVVQLGNRPGSPRILFEAKASRDPRYVADGLYKLLGYESDYRGALAPFSDECPIGFLVVLGGAELSVGAERSGHRLWISTAESFDHDLEKSLGSYLRG